MWSSTRRVLKLFGEIAANPLFARYDHLTARAIPVVALRPQAHA